MKHVKGWWWPDKEQHLLDWLASPKNNVVLNGRAAYQGRKQLAAMELVPKDQRRTAIDVGAHIGLWSFNLAHWFKKVEAFEPVPAHQDCFQKNVLDVHGNDKVELREFALGDHEDMVSIYTADTSSGDSWVKGKGTIPMKTLDSFGFENVDFIKIDCEGYEEYVLRGGEKTVKASWPVICVEQKRDMAQKKFGLGQLGAVKLLRSWGYKVVTEISGDYLMTHP